MWPFTDGGAAGPQAVWLALYLVTFALHVVLVGYVVGGSAYALVAALRRTDDPIAARVRDLLPFMLGLGITAGVAPLLFLQLLYQHRFYSANLILGPRWGAVVPALITGFYALYLVKATARPLVRRLALGVALATFVFVAWSWTEINGLMQDQAAWRAMYAAGERLYAEAGIAPRLGLWLGAMATLFATVAAWWTPGADRRRLAVIALAGRTASGVAAAVLALAGSAVIGAAHGWAYLMLVALAVELGGWIATLRAPDGRGLAVVTAAGTVALLAGTVVREAPRLTLLEAPRAAAAHAAGLWVFALTLAVGILAIAWIVRGVRRAG